VCGAAEVCQAGVVAGEGQDDVVAIGSAASPRRLGRPSVR
jgi:hypothetical protein